jgi:hypothetical protein
MAKINRAVTVEQLTKTKFKDLELPDEFKKLLGEPEQSGVWIIWGESFNGKTTFCMQLSKALCVSQKVFYNTLEEGARKSMQKAIVSQNMQEVKRRFLIGNREEIDDMIVRMNKRNSPGVYIIDSLQYTGMTKLQYKKLKAEALKLDKLLIFVSHADGKWPKGALADFVRYDADIKIRVEGYQATCLSRLGGDRNPYTIWAEGAQLYNIEIK